MAGKRQVASRSRFTNDGRGYGMSVLARGWFSMRKALRCTFMLLCSAAILAVSAAPAFAGDGYAAGGVAGESTGGGVSGGGTLPFTGGELALYVVVGLLVIGSGLALRGYSARRAS